MSDSLIGFIGAIIGGICSLVATYMVNNHSKKEAQRTEKESIKAFLQAIQNEIGTLWELYKRGAGDFLEKTNNGYPFLYKYIVKQDYFIIYNKNSHFLGKINDALLREQIIITYTKSKAIVDSYTLNNSILEKYENMILLFQQTQNIQFKNNADEYLNSLKDYCDKLKFLHEELKEEMSKLQPMITIILRQDIRSYCNFYNNF